MTMANKKGVVNTVSDIYLGPKKKPAKKMEPKLVASKEDDEREVKYIAGAYKIPIKVVRSTMLAVGKNGKPSRSRTAIYAGLRALGWKIEVKRKK